MLLNYFGVFYQDGLLSQSVCPLLCASKILENKPSPQSSPRWAPASWPNLRCITERVVFIWGEIRHGSGSRRWRGWKEDEIPCYANFDGIFFHFFDNGTRSSLAGHSSGIPCPPPSAIKTKVAHGEGDVGGGGGEPSPSPPVASSTLTSS